MDSRKEAQFLSAYNEYADLVFRYCFFKTTNMEEAKDMAQETFIKSWNYIRTGGKISNMRAFFMRTAHNIVIDYYRKKKAVSLDNLFEQGFDVGTDGSDRMKDQIDGAQVMKLLDRIPQAYRDVVFMQYVQGLSVKEISEVLGESPNNVSVKIHRALKKIKELYNNNGK